MSTNVPALQWTPNGLSIPAQQAILAGVEEDINAAFGGGLGFDPTTPQGQLAATEAAVVGARYSDIASLVSALDPAYSFGRYQDAIGRLFGMSRIAGTPSTVTCVCGGAPGATIPAGALAWDGTNIWACNTAGVISSGGTVSLPFSCLTAGPVACGANQVNQIFQQVPGWTTVNNPSAGTLGTVAESRNAFEQRRQASLQANAQGMIQAVRGAVLNLGVTDCWAYDNGSNTSTTVNGVTIPANSIYVAVAPGSVSNAAIAQAIWIKKGGGAPYYGDTTVTVYDQSPGYEPPYPSYAVTFKTVAALPILFAVQIPNTAQVPANYQSLIQNAIINAAGGADGGAPFKIGATVYASRFVAPIAALGAWAMPISVQVGTSSANQNSVTPTAAQIPSVTATNISVTLV